MIRGAGNPERMFDTRVYVRWTLVGITVMLEGVLGWFIYNSWNNFNQDTGAKIMIGSLLMAGLPFICKQADTMLDPKRKEKEKETLYGEIRERIKVTQKHW